MTKDFERKVLAKRIVDTKQYRYTVKDCYDSDKQWAEIRRIAIDKLDTTAAIDGWETVKIIRAE